MNISYTSHTEFSKNVKLQRDLLKTLGNIEILNSRFLQGNVWQVEHKLSSCQTCLCKNSIIYFLYFLKFEADRFVISFFC